VVFPVHPRTGAVLEEEGWRADGVRLLPPQSYIRFLSLMTSAAAVVTDSGGIQEETTVLGIPCFTLRDSTERPITVREGTNQVVGTGPDALARLLELLPAAKREAVEPPERWDGRAAARAADALIDRLGGAPAGAPRFERTA
jgi:UDP-N-acetylglucosamine 2-epimerase (non-hydrolysing)